MVAVIKLHKSDLHRPWSRPTVERLHENQRANDWLNRFISIARQQRFFLPDYIGVLLYPANVRLEQRCSSSNIRRRGTMPKYSSGARQFVAR